MKTTIQLEELEQILKGLIREVIQEELMKLRAVILPTISDAEQVDFEKLYGKPTNDGKRAIEIDL